MKAEEARLMTKRERFSILAQMIEDAAQDGDDSILLHHSWVKGIRTVLLSAGYTLTEWEGQNGAYYGRWVKVSWEE